MHYRYYKGNNENRRFQYTPWDQEKRKKVVSSLVYGFTLAVLLFCLNHTVLADGTEWGKIRDIIYGIGGNLCYLLPFIPCILATRDNQNYDDEKILLDIPMIVALFACVHIFYAQRIIDERMTISGFSNFVVKSYEYGRGGGAIGALLAWPLYRYIGEVGGFIVALLILLMCLNATGRIERLVGFISNRAERRSQGQPAKIEREFDELAPRPRRRQPRRDPVNEDALINREGLRPQRLSREAVAQSARPERKAPARKKKLYIDDIEKVTLTKAAPESAPEQGNSIDFLDNLEDFESMEARDILKEADDSRRSFKPDRANITEKRVERDAEAVSSDAQMNDELKNEPEVHETPDDEAPFDIPSRQRVKKEELPVIKREEAKVMVEEDKPVYNYPPIDLLEAGEPEDISKHARRDREKAQLLEETLRSFGIEAKLTGIAHGPAVTRFELQPAPGIKVSRITSLSDDIALNLAATSVSIEVPFPGKAIVSVEIPNDEVEMVRLRDVLESQEARIQSSRIAVGLGKDNSGRYIVADIAQMPHVLIAGQTGSGKSACINTIIVSILLRSSPEEVRLILVDPKMIELSIYNDIPHLVCPVVTDPKKAASALDWAVAEMTRRYKMFTEKGVGDIKGYNRTLGKGEKAMPQLVIIINELVDLMTLSPVEVEDSICRIGQMGHKAGIHMIISAFHPSAQIMTGSIRNSIPTRIAFLTASNFDSRMIINESGAEKLRGNGDMLFVPKGSEPIRVQGAWVSDVEVHAIVEYIKQGGTAEYDPDMIVHMEGIDRSEVQWEVYSAEYDPKLPEAVDIVLELGQASISMLQHHMRIGYARAGRIIDEMSRRGIVSEADGSKPRTVLMSREQINELFEGEK